MIDIKRVQSRLLEMAKVVHGILDSNSIPYVITYGTLLGAVRHGGFIPWDDDFDIYLFDDTYEQAMEVLSKQLPDDLFLENEDTEPKYFHGWAHIKDLHTEAICELYPQDGQYLHHGLCIDLYKATKIRREELTLFQLQQRLDYYKRKYNKGLMTEIDYSHQSQATINEIEKEKNRIKNYIENNSNPYIYGFMSLDGDMFEIDEVYPIKKYQFEDTEFCGPNTYDSFLRRCYGDYMQLPPDDKRKPHYSSVVFYD